MSVLPDDYLGELRQVFSRGGVALGAITYEDLTGHPDLDGLDVSDTPSLLQLGAHAGGINVFFVRSLSPVGLQTFGPSPGPAGLAATPQSGIVIGIDTLCYRTWSDVARITAHEIARYMGLYHNVELDGIGHDPIRCRRCQADPSTNLMFYSELGGTALSTATASI